MFKKTRKNTKITLSTTNPPPTKHIEETRSVAKDARVHYADLKQQPHQHPHPHTQEHRQREDQNNHTTPHRVATPHVSPHRVIRLILQDPTVC